MSPRSSFRDIAARANAMIDPSYEVFCTFAEDLIDFANTVNRLGRQGEHGIQLCIRIDNLPSLPQALVISIRQNMDQDDLDTPFFMRYTLANGRLTPVGPEQRSSVFDKAKLLDPKDPDEAKAYLLALLLSEAGPVIGRKITDGLAKLDTLTAAPSSTARAAPRVTAPGNT